MDPSGAISPDALKYELAEFNPRLRAANPVKDLGEVLPNYAKIGGLSLLMLTAQRPRYRLVEAAASVATEDDHRCGEVVADLLQPTCDLGQRAHESHRVNEVFFDVFPVIGNRHLRKTEIRRQQGRPCDFLTLPTTHGDTSFSAATTAAASSAGEGGDT